MSVPKRPANLFGEADTFARFVRSARRAAAAAAGFFSQHGRAGEGPRARPGGRGRRRAGAAAGGRSPASAQRPFRPLARRGG